MKFKTTIVYQEGYLPTERSRKLRFKDIEEIVYTEINEISTNDSPVAFICDSFEYRLYKNNLYVKTQSDAIVCNMKDKTAIERLAYAFEFCSTFYGFNEGDSKEKMINKANEEANQYLIIDGEVWEKSGEPRYVSITFGLGHNHGSTDLMIDNWYNTNINKDCYFNALQREEAIKLTKERAIRRGDTESVNRIGNHNIEVLIPKAVKCNPQVEAGESRSFQV